MRLVAGILVYTLLAWSAAAAPGTALQARMTGSFRLAESETSVEQRLAAAIEQAVEPMNFVARPIARSRLQRPVYYCKRYELALGAETVRIACDDRPPLARRLDNTDGPYAPDGEPLDVRVQIAGETVEIVFVGADGTRTTTYRFDDAGALEVSVKVESKSLERPVAWKVRYRRSD
jgi:hypothetical protein